MLGDLSIGLRLAVVLSWLIVVVIWSLGPALLAAGMAARRGAHVGLWVLVGLIAGWAGLVILWALGGPVRRCPACKMSVPQGARRCGHCREEIALPR